ncbi:unnamed protein product [Miscanthus lutarioriparius]|uniref:Uncharacterized protein n=1 Tax=Miscanthus lutarioriparius TaxID=422564 RepID=A0A811PDR1_9POAL|nr:unnamed protein product [Miscanthus lutarioriparius]
MASANGSSGGGGKGFEVPKVDIRFTKLFIGGKFVDAVSGTYAAQSLPLQSPPCPPMVDAILSSLPVPSRFTVPVQKQNPMATIYTS